MLTEEKMYHENGQLYVLEFRLYGKLEGESKMYHENGQVKMRGFYQSGKLERECKIWYDNGQLQSRAFYKDGKLNGKYRSWHTNGAPYESEFYRDGVFDGEAKIWNGCPALYYWNNRDKSYCGFVNTKKFLQIRPRLYKRLIQQNKLLIEQVLISDLINIVCHS